MKQVPKEMPYDQDTLNGAFISGFRFALFELIHAFSAYTPLTPEQEKVLTAVGTRQICALDRGVEYMDLSLFLNKLTADIALKRWNRHDLPDP
jgi:hypothetical protein